jgi:hypothetical protein
VSPASARDLAAYMMQTYRMSQYAAETFVLLWCATKPVRHQEATIKNGNLIEFCEAWTLWSKI